MQICDLLCLVILLTTETTALNLPEQILAEQGQCLCLNDYKSRLRASSTVDSSSYSARKQRQWTSRCDQLF